MDVGSDLRSRVSALRDRMQSRRGSLSGVGLCAPVVISLILSVIAVIAAVRHQKSEVGSWMGAAESGSVWYLIGGSLLFAAFLWALCYYGYESASWFFLLAPMVVGLVELNAVTRV